jgi:hypothetical protein
MAQELGIRTRTKIAFAIECLILTLLGILLYGDSTRLPFFFDDVIHFRWLERHTFWEIWTGAESLGYYRPTTAALWDLSRALLGWFRPWPLHALNVGVHIANAALVTVLTRVILRNTKRPIGFLAGVLFLTFPFSYQVVPWVAALNHPLVTLLTLGALLTHILAQEGAGWRWRALSLGLAVAAFFTHETGVIVGGWLLAYELLINGGHDEQRPSAWPLAYVALGLLYIPLYFSLPRAAGSLPALSRERLTQNGAYLSQALTFPLAPMARRTMDLWSWSDLRAAYLAAALTGGLLAAAALHRRLWRPLGFGVSCAAIALVPAWLTLPFDYLISGPRVLYLASVGAAIAWACVFRALVEQGSGRWRRLITGGTIALFALVVTSNARFIRTRQYLHLLGGDLIRQVSDAAAAADPEAQMLVVNYPAWMAPERVVYPVGHEGVEFMPIYTDVSDLVWANRGVERDVETVRFPNALTPLPGFYAGVRGPDVGWEALAAKLRAADRSYRVRFTPRRLWLDPAGRVRAGAPRESVPLATFDGRVALMAAQDEHLENATHALRLTWHAPGPLDDGEYRVFAHAYDEAGNLLAQADGYPMAGLYPFWMWRTDERLEEIRFLTPPTNPPADVHHLAVGIYDGTTGERLPARTPDGTRLPNDAVPIPPAQ